MTKSRGLVGRSGLLVAYDDHGSHHHTPQDDHQRDNELANRFCFVAFLLFCWQFIHARKLKGFSAGRNTIAQGQRLLDCWLAGALMVLSQAHFLAAGGGGVNGIQDQLDFERFLQGHQRSFALDDALDEMMRRFFSIRNFWR